MRDGAWQRLLGIVGRQDPTLVRPPVTTRIIREIGNDLQDDIQLFYVLEHTPHAARNNALACNYSKLISCKCLEPKELSWNNYVGKLKREHNLKILRWKRTEILCAQVYLYFNVTDMPKFTQEPHRK